jgi:opacity protein-like surface antigen
MSGFSGKFGLAVVVTVLCLTGSAAHAQSEPVRYWIPFGPFGFGGGAAETTSMETYSDVPNFNFGDPNKKGFVFRSYSAPVSALTSGFGWNSLGGATAFSSLDSLSYERTQLGYSFKGAGDLPMTLFGGVDTLKYNQDAFSAITSFSPNTGAAAAYSVHGGVEVRPTSNMSLSISAGFTQQQTGLADGAISSSLLPRELGGLR